MIKLRDTFPQFPNNGDQVNFLGTTFTYNQQLNYWVDDVNATVDEFKYWWTVIHATTKIYFNKEIFDWNTFITFDSA